MCHHKLLKSTQILGYFQMSFKCLCKPFSFMPRSESSTPPNRGLGMRRGGKLSLHEIQNQQYIITKG